MREYRFRLVNVFAESTFGGNPLCVFEDGSGLTDAEMQSLALQFNLSETTFILTSTCATARVRIYTPTFEMAFAGHPTLGTSHIVREMKSTGDEITLEMIAGVIPVHGQVDRWTLSANAAITRPAGFTQRDIADMLGLDENDVLPGACWVNTGSDQLIVPLVSEHSVRRAHPMPERLARVSSETGRSMAYIFAPLGDGRLISRFFFLKHGSVIEDPGTGSATANLGGWFIQSGARLPLAYTIDQGEAAGRPCRIGLSVDAGGHIFVSGRVVEIGRGTISLPPGASGE